ncbi:hypothetical protein N0V93_004592 [Gnomoniopsis smithogilvyi]|uniref:O-methyltransferase domain-containing protein n=1 Tax=Gnomoniopsis smithogilvyi TaxID=1191159 RepID=A0A9W9CWC0_9PEZI|nr:hypothetical protein N0V93_004592 [Gnomoniopsis smithogilvyi]
MQSTLKALNSTLRHVLHELRKESNSLSNLLHSTDELPHKTLYTVASEALDLLGELRLLLEPAHVILADHFLGYTNSKALCAAVALNVADHLESGPRTLSDLASDCNARPDRLKQVIRTLYNNGIFYYDASNDLIENNHVSRLLKTDHWTQWHNWADLYGSEFYDMARGIPQACRSDATRNPAQINFDTDDSMFKYFHDRGWLPKFHRTLSGGAVAQAPGILCDYPWAEIASSQILDIGGGTGGLIALLLRAHRSMTGGILDVSSVIEQARLNFHSSTGQYADIGDRVEPGNLVSGDFFKEVPVSDVYTLKWVLHDWDDDKARLILKNVRKSITRTPLSRLVVLESVLRDGNAGKLSRYADMNMMVAVGGQERDEAAWARLAKETGWELRSIYPLRNAWPSAIELFPAWDGNNTESNRDSQQSLFTSIDDEVLAVSMKFLQPWSDKKGIPFVRACPAPGYTRTNFEWRDYIVQLHNARPKKDDFTLDTHGFAYFQDDISPGMVDILRGEDKGAVRDYYYEHVKNFVKRITKAERVILFDHTLRKRRLELSETQNRDGKEQPATMVHCDQSELGALRRLQANIGSEENLEDILGRRVQMINVWRPLNGPIQDWPLATMDYRSVNDHDMHICDLLKDKYEVRGQTTTFTYSDKHSWYYLPEQRTNEVTVIKIWDNKLDGRPNKDLL